MRFHYGEIMAMVNHYTFSPGNTTDNNYMNSTFSATLIIMKNGN